MTAFTSNIQKGGALLDDARRVVEVWDLDHDAAWNLAYISEENLLAKASRARTRDVLLRVLRPRLVEPGPQVIAALKQLLSSPRGFADAYYFEATRDDALLAAFAEGPLFDWWERGRIGVDVESVSAWLADLAEHRQTPEWTETIRTKVARGLAGRAARLRDPHRRGAEGIRSSIAQHRGVRIRGVPPARGRGFIARVGRKPGLEAVVARRGSREGALPRG